MKWLRNTKLVYKTVTWYNLRSKILNKNVLPLFNREYFMVSVLVPTVDQIKAYVDLYNTGLNLCDIDLGKLNFKNAETFNVLSLSNTPIRVVDRTYAYKNIYNLEKIKHFITDHLRMTKTGEVEKVSGNKYFYMVPVQTVRGTIVGFILRRTFGSGNKNRYHSILLHNKSLDKKVPFMYGFYKDFLDFEDGKTCKPIVVCEGLKDCIFLKQFYPYVLANNGSSLGVSSYILRNLTNKVVLVYDNDKTGESSLIKDTRELRRIGCYVSTISIKDLGVKDVAECMGNSLLTDMLKNRFLNVLSSLNNL